MSATTTPEQCLLDYRKRVLALARQADPPPPLCRGAALRRAWAGAAPMRRHDAVVAALGLDALPAACFGDADSELALLDPEPLRRMLLARALYSRLDALRHCVERAPRQWFAERLGQPVWQWLRGCVAAPSRMPLLARDADASAWHLDGWCRLVADGVWPWPGLARLAAASAGVDPGDAALTADARSRDFVSQWRAVAQPDTAGESAA
ncbi:type III secretion protein HrpB4 [Xanthomonas theicola]|uniref:Transcriptional regulator n=1 Tax=Xanthomonas theicola TaxID=56464 RepID=A0A2S6ZJ98_9XANT|nr:type III secretion protein HrpB4 [Xanthomonas theicola]PPT92343.1 transcriptional regulator [Xanthomonas theicola]QNH23687.1 transcriptional regulator [Xanthomonas theicola]